MLYRSFAALLLRYEPRMSTKKRVRECEKDPVDQKQQTSTLAKLHTKRFAWQRGDTLAKPDSFAHDRFFIFFYIFCCCAQFTYCRNSDDSHFLYRTIGWIFNHFTTVFTTCIRGWVCAYFAEVRSLVVLLISRTNVSWLEKGDENHIRWRRMARYLLCREEGWIWVARWRKNAKKSRNGNRTVKEAWKTWNGNRELAA